MVRRQSELRVPDEEYVYLALSIVGRTWFADDHLELLIVLAISSLA